MRQLIAIAAFFLSLAATTQSVSAEAQVNRKKLPGLLPTELSELDRELERRDKERYPNFMKLLASVEPTDHMRSVDPRNAHFIKTTHVFFPDQKLWNAFFKAAATDQLTVLRSFALLARELKKYGVSLWGPGHFFEDAVKKNNVDLGLAIPAKNIGAALWSPDPAHKDPEFQVHLKVLYTEPFVHQFPDHILPANLKVGFGDELTYWLSGKQYTHKALETDIYYGPKNGVGFRNVRGVGGQKRGFMGFMQSVLFFLPDAVDAMVIREERNAMITEALVNTTVDDFEKDPKYAIKILK